MVWIRHGQAVTVPVTKLTDLLSHHGLLPCSPPKFYTSVAPATDTQPASGQSVFSLLPGLAVSLVVMTDSSHWYS